MRRRFFSFVVAAVLILPFATSSSAVPDGETPLSLAVRGRLPPDVIQTANGPRTVPTFSGGLLAAARQAVTGDDGSSPATDGGAEPQRAGRTVGCSDRNPGGNIRVNLDCGFAPQAEQLIKVNPLNPQNLIAAQNDHLIGNQHCVFDFSFEGGKTWGSGPFPLSRTNNPPAGHTILGGAGTGHPYDVEADPMLAFRAAGLERSK